MSISDTRDAKKYASIAEVAAAQCKQYTDDARNAPQYADEAKASADASAASAEQSSASSQLSFQSATSASNSASAALTSANNASASAATAGSAAAAAVQGIYDNLASSDAGKGASLIETSLSGVSVQDFIDNTATLSIPHLDNMSALIEFGNLAGEGGTVNIQPGVYRFSSPGLIPSCNYVGVGQGAVVFEIDASIPHVTFFDFAQPLNRCTERGFRHITFKTINSNGNYLIGTVGTSGFNSLQTKNTFQNLSFISNQVDSTIGGFPQEFGWKFIFHLGDSWMLRLESIDALGCYKPDVDPTTQFLDGFVRFNPTQGILSARVSNITTHNIANGFEIVKKTYFCLDNIDIAASYRGVYDADDRVFESNAYAYGESVWDNVIINSQLAGVSLANRFDLFAIGLVVHRAASGFDHGQDWKAIYLSKPRVCTISGCEIGTSPGYSGNKIGIETDSGDCINIDNISFSSLDTCIQAGVSSSSLGATQAMQVGRVSLFGNCNKVFDIQSARQFKCNGFSKSSAYAYITFVSYGDTATQLSSEFINCPTNAVISYDTQLRLSGQGSSTDLKNWLIDTSNGLSLQTRSDSNAVGNNAIIIQRSALVVSSVELRSDASSGYTQLTGATARFTGVLRPTTDNIQDIGTTALKPRSIYSYKYMYTATVGDFYGTSSPEGALTGGVGSTYRRTDGGAATCFYIKESGSGNTGWVAK